MKNIDSEIYMAFFSSFLRFCFGRQILSSKNFGAPMMLMPGGGSIVAKITSGT